MQCVAQSGSPERFGLLSGKRNLPASPSVAQGLKSLKTRSEARPPGPCASNGRKGRRLIGAPKVPNGCQYVVPRLLPIGELDAELVGRLGMVDKIRLVDAQESAARR